MVPNSLAHNIRSRPRDIPEPTLIDHASGWGWGSCGKIIVVATSPDSARQLAPGKLLIAAVELSDGVFDHTVVLLLDADDDGALGVVLNEINDVALESVLPQWVELVSHPSVLFRGGPVSPQGAICLASLARADEEPPGWRPVF